MSEIICPLKVGDKVKLKNTNLAKTTNSKELVADVIYTINTISNFPNPTSFNSKAVTPYTCTVVEMLDRQGFFNYYYVDCFELVDSNMINKQNEEFIEVIRSRERLLEI